MADNEWQSSDNALRSVIANEETIDVSGCSRQEDANQLAACKQRQWVRQAGRCRSTGGKHSESTDSQREDKNEALHG